VTGCALAFPPSTSGLSVRVENTIERVEVHIGLVESGPECRLHDGPVCMHGSWTLHGDVGTVRPF
jgi:hypothetical protein